MRTTDCRPDLLDDAEEVRIELMMDQIFSFLAQHGYLVLFLLVLAEQIGLPTPATPFLLAGGALAKTGQLDFGAAFAVCVVASLISDIVWFELGRRRGSSVMAFLCRISLEPDSCVRTTEELFAKHGAKSLIVAKFVPALNTAAPPMAGIFGMRRSRFLLYDTIGSVVWAGSIMSVGFVFGEQLERLVERGAELGGWLVAGALLALTIFIASKYFKRRRFLRELRVARISPQELASRMRSEDDLVIVDLRHSLDFEKDPRSVPGAIHLTVEEVEQRYREIPTTGETILLCT